MIKSLLFFLIILCPGLARAGVVTLSSYHNQNPGEFASVKGVFNEVNLGTVYGEFSTKGLFNTGRIFDNANPRIFKPDSGTFKQNNGIFKPPVIASQREFGPVRVFSDKEASQSAKEFKSSYGNTFKTCLPK